MAPLELRVGLFIARRESIAMAINNESILNKLKRAAKTVRRANPSVKQSQALDAVANLLGFNNWSLVSKHVNSMTPLHAVIFDTGLYALPKLAAILAPQFPPFNRDSAIEEMRDWVRGKYTPLVEFAFHDNESETGYAWPDEDLSEGLQDMFGDKYPFELINEVAQDMEIDQGPWGIEDYGHDEDEEPEQGSIDAPQFA